MSILVASGYHIDFSCISNDSIKLIICAFDGAKLYDFKKLSFILCYKYFINRTNPCKTTCLLPNSTSRGTCGRSQICILDGLKIVRFLPTYRRLVCRLL